MCYVQDMVAAPGCSTLQMSGHKKCHSVKCTPLGTVHAISCTDSPVQDADATSSPPIDATCVCELTPPLDAVVAEFVDGITLRDWLPLTWLSRVLG